MPRTRRSQPTVGLPPISLDKENGGPLYLRVARHIETSMVDGHLSPGDRLDGEIGLADSLGVSRQTMRKAIDELVRQGLLVRRHRAGTQVLPTRSDRTGGTYKYSQADDGATALEIPYGTPPLGSTASAPQQG